MKADVIELESGGLPMRAFSLGDGEPVVLVHGFPDSAQLWREVAPLLVSQGFRVVMPDMRGYGESAAPAGKENYSLQQLGSDVLNLMNHLSIERAHLVGHDWGASVSWYLAGHHSDRFLTLSALSVGHPGAYSQGGVKQLVRAWYILLFLAPGFAEWVLSRADYSLFRRLTKHAEADRWVADLSRQGRLTAALDWYRRNVPDMPRVPRCSLPVLGVWSSEDQALTETQMTASSRFTKASFRYECIEGASHWIPLDAPAALSRILGEHFRQLPSES